MKDKELKMKLLEELMSEMDESALVPLKEKMSKPMAVIEEKQVLPADEAEEAIHDKLEKAFGEEQSDLSEDEMEDDDMDSDFIKRLRAARK